MNQPEKIIELNPQTTETLMALSARVARLRGFLLLGQVDAALKEAERMQKVLPKHERRHWLAASVER